MATSTNTTNTSESSSSSSMELRKLEELKFDNLALRALPLDPIFEERSHSRQVRGACFSRVVPTPVHNPTLVACSLPALRDLLGLDAENESKRPEFAEYFSGNRVLPGAEPAAHCYCGHQFGNFAGQLGDGATMYLGEVINPKGERWEIQFKGAGKTPYSRSADGRKVLRSSIREFLCSEANHALGIPTTRAGTVVTSDTRIERDLFYTGNVILERCTVVLRIAPSFLRFGSFEIFKGVDPETGRQGPSHGLENTMLPKMLAYVIQNFYPDIWNNHPDGHHDGPLRLENEGETAGVDLEAWKAQREARRNMYADFYAEVVRRTARLVAEWQCVGFCHGVLNTDNMSILGLTIDYGPFGFMDAYDPDFICNGSDNGGRYAYSKQPEICRWNCRKLAEALAPALPLSRSLVLLEEIYDDEFKRHYDTKMRKKLGLIKKDLGEEDTKLVEDLLSTMRLSYSDFTNSFRGLSCIKLTNLSIPEKETTSFTQTLDYLAKQTSSVEFRVKACKPSIPPQQLQMLLSLAQQDPRMLYMFGIDPEVLNRDISKLKRMRELESLPVEKKDAEDRLLWGKWLSRYRERLQKEIEGLTSAEIEALDKERAAVMNSNNPRFVLRNYIAQKAIETAEKGDFSEVNRVLDVMTHPYSDDPKYSQEGHYDLTPPQWAADLCVT